MPRLVTSLARRSASAGWQLILPFALIAVWWVWSAGSSSLYFPPLSDVLSAFARTWGGSGFTQHVVPSLRNFILGFAIGSAIGIGLGTALGRLAWLRWLLAPLNEYARALAPPALLPFAVLILGIGSSMQIAIIAFAVVFSVLLNTVDGVRGMEPTLDEVSAVYRLPLRIRLAQVILPAASPQILVGLRTGLSIAVLMMMVSEMIAANRGIGFFTLQAQQNFAYVDMWSGMILLAVIGVVVNLLFARFVERPLMFWHHGSAGRS